MHTVTVTRAVYFNLRAVIRESRVSQNQKFLSNSDLNMLPLPFSTVKHALALPRVILSFCSVFTFYVSFEKAGANDRRRGRPRSLSLVSLSSAGFSGIMVPCVPYRIR